MTTMDRVDTHRKCDAFALVLNLLNENAPERSGAFRFVCSFTVY